MAASVLSGRCFSQALPVVSWEISTPRISLREPVLIKLNVNNQTNEVVILQLGVDFKEALSVRIITPDGNMLLRPTMQMSGIRASGRVRIEPGAHYSREYVVDDWYDFTSPGKYGIGMDLSLPIMVGDRNVRLPGEVFQSVLIDVYDPAALRQRCEALLTRILQPVLSGDVAAAQDADQAMWALSSVHDPVVVPYLARALKSLDSGAQLLALRTLEKFLTAESIGVLIPYAQGTNMWSAQASAALHRMAPGVQDPVLRNQVYDVLGETPKR